MSSSKSLRMSSKMTDHEVDEVAFLTGEPNSSNKRILYERDRIAVCSQKRALALALFVFFTLFLVALVIAFATPLSGCSLHGALDFDGSSLDDGLDGGKLLTPTGEEYPWPHSRLPTDVRPLHYTISIHPNLTTLDVTGWVVIHFIVENETDHIVFHAHNMKITEKWVREGVDDGSLDAEKLQNISSLLEYVPYQQRYLKLNDGSCLYPGRNYSLGIRFQTKINTELEGFYLSSYTTQQGEKRVLATTHFEPTYARSAFPCFDEPQFKATFKMIIIRNQLHKSLFNMPIKKIENVYYAYNMELWRDEFEESVEMSTYLVAFVVCDYVNIGNKTKNNVTVSIHTPPGLINQANFALQTAVQLMEYYDGFFGVPYPLPKQDLIAIPDFGAGAMENWGLITFYETSILYDPIESSSAAHQWVAVVVAHELAHQWFGNLVTMEWWTHLWLSEGFASFVEYVGVDYIRPEWKMLEQFVLEKTQPALSLDGLRSSHPIFVEVKDPKSIESIFDTISYNKGAAILRMLESVIGEEILRKGLMMYLNEHKFSSAQTDDLWSALSRSTNGSIEVKTIMDTWTTHMGFPLIRVRLEDRTVKISQERFVMNPMATNESIESITDSLLLPRPRFDPEYLWYVPLSYVTDLQPRNVEFVWLNKTQSYEFPMPYRSQWIKFNSNQTGYYRVLYEGDLWNSILNVLLTNPSVFTPTDRANLIDDVFTLSKAGFISAEFPLELSQYLLKETEYVPWATALEHFRSWSKVLHEKPSHRLLLQYLLKILDPIYRNVGWSDSGSHLTKLLRGDILSTAIHCDNKDAIREARNRFNSWMEKGVRLPPNLREVVYSAGVKFGGATAWEYCWGQYNKTQIPSEKKLLLKAMGSASDPWLLQQYLNNCLDRDRVRSQDIRTVLSVVAANPNGRLQAWRHLRIYWEQLESVFGKGSFTMGSLISAVVTHFSREFDYQEVQNYFSNRDVGSGQRALNQSLETIELNIRWLESNERTIEVWLQNHLK